MVKFDVEGAVLRDSAVKINCYRVCYNDRYSIAHAQLLLILT